MAGWEGMMTLDTGDHAAANRLMTLMPRHKVGYLAVSLGYFNLNSSVSRLRQPDQGEPGPCAAAFWPWRR